MIDLLILLVLTDSEEEEQSLGHAQISNVKNYVSDQKRRDTHVGDTQTIRIQL